MSAEAQRLLQAVAHFKARTRGAELPKGAEDALKGIEEAFSQPMPERDTPGAREALKVAPGTKGTGVPMEQAAKGSDSPGKREAASLSEQIRDAAKEAVAEISAS